MRMASISWALNCPKTSKASCKSWSPWLSMFSERDDSEFIPIVLSVSLSAKEFNEAEEMTSERHGIGSKMTLWSKLSAVVEGCESAGPVGLVLSTMMDIAKHGNGTEVSVSFLVATSFSGRPVFSFVD